MTQLANTKSRWIDPICNITYIIRQSFPPFKLTLKDKRRKLFNKLTFFVANPLCKQCKLKKVGGKLWTMQPLKFIRNRIMLLVKCIYAIPWCFLRTFFNREQLIDEVVLHLSPFYLTALRICKIHGMLHNKSCRNKIFECFSVLSSAENILSLLRISKNW